MSIFCELALHCSHTSSCFALSVSLAINKALITNNQINGIAINAYKILFAITSIKYKIMNEISPFL